MCVSITKGYQIKLQLITFAIHLLLHLPMQT
jgi:hypothetical protein